MSEYTTVGAASSRDCQLKPDTAQNQVDYLVRSFPVLTITQIPAAVENDNLVAGTWTKHNASNLKAARLRARRADTARRLVDRHQRGARHRDRDPSAHDVEQ